MKSYKHLNQILTLQSASHKDGRRLCVEDLSIVNDGAIVFDQERIAWVGKTADLPTEFSNVPSINLQGHILTPEIVDSHTHIVFGGDRAQEYADRLNGISYE